MNDSIEGVAARLAARGREALVERLRTAFADAAKAHADIVEMDEQRIEALVQRSADRADGLQWRRALATIASEELGIGLTEALHHPAVERAQELVGAPSYEQSLAELTKPPVQRPEAAAKVPSESEAEPEPTAAPEPEAAAASQVEPEPAAESEVESEVESEPAAEVESEVAHAAAHEEELDDYDEEDDWEYDDEYIDEDTEEAAAVSGGREGDAIQLTAIHLGGVANLPASAEPVELRLSSDGLDIMRSNSQILGRLGWREIDALEVPIVRGRRRRKAERARLVVRTRNGDASFEIPEISSEELRERVRPLVARYGRG